MAVAMTAEEAQGRIENLEQQVNQLHTWAKAEHERSHVEITQAKAQIAAISNAGGKGDFRLIDPKSMKPDKIGGTSGPPWRQWSENTRAFVEMLSRDLANYLKLVEGRDQPLTPEEIEQAAIPESHAGQMGRYLKLNSEGNANTMIKASQA